MNPVSKLSSLLQAKLLKRQSQNALRSLSLEHSGIDFYSNDYLGLARNHELHHRILARLSNENLGTQINGSSGSRLLAGNSELAQETETLVAQHFKSEKALIYSSGYAANTGVISCIPTRHDLILLDELSHASLKEGARLSLAKKLFFRHNDLAHLAKIAQATQAEHIYVVTESVFSMDGDTAPIAELVELCEKLGLILILDEAHSTGIMGKNGAGLSVSLDLEKQIPIRIHTFGKGAGVHGAAVCASLSVIDYLINFSQPFIYSTAPSAHFYISIQESLKMLEEKPELLANLQAIIKAYNFHSQTYQGKISQNNSAIQYIELGSNEATLAFAQQLKKAGILAKAVLPPTVPQGKARIRICLHSYNTESELRTLFS